MKDHSTKSILEIVKIVEKCLILFQTCTLPKDIFNNKSV